MPNFTQSVQAIREHPAETVKLRVFLPYGGMVEYELRDTQLLPLALQLLQQVRPVNS